MKLQLFTRPLLAWLLFVGFAALEPARAQTTNVVNDGTSAVNLTLRQNLHGRGTPAANLVLSASGGELTAAQSPDYSDFPINGIWFDRGVSPATNTYAILADARPVQGFPEYVVGVMAWFDPASGTGLAFRVMPGTFGSFQVATIDFEAETREANDSVNQLFLPSGAAAEAFVGSAWADLGTYDAGANATFRLEISPPTPAEIAAVTNGTVTARFKARVFQAEAGAGEPVQVGGQIELLTTLPVPGTNRFGYFASWQAVVVPGDTIGYLDNLRLIGDLRRENLAPTVAITAPANGAQFDESTVVPVIVEANDAEGRLTRVDLYSDNVLVGTANSSPAVFAVPGLAPGSHVLRAEAADEMDARGESAPVNIEILPNAPPTVAISSPASGSQFSEPAAVNVTVVANDPEGRLARVELYRDNALIASNSLSPATFVINEPAAGSHLLRAEAVDEPGARGVSTEVTYHILPNFPPTVSITSPTNGSQFIQPTVVSVEVEANDPEGRLLRVDLFSDNVLVGTTNRSPANFQVSGLVAGNHALRAEAVDEAGATTPSALVTIQVLPPSEPPRLIQPTPLPSGTDFQQFKFSAVNLTTGSYRIESTTNFTTWAEAQTGAITGPTMDFTLPRVVNGDRVYYRLAIVTAGGLTPASLASPTRAPSAADFQQFQFVGEGLTGTTYEVESSSDLNTWTKVEEGAVSGPSHPFSFPRVAGAASVFYRIVSRP